MSLKELVAPTPVETAPPGCWRIILWIHPKVKVNSGAFPLGDNEWASSEGFETKAEADLWTDSVYREVSPHPFFGIAIEAIGPRFFPAE